MRIKKLVTMLLCLLLLCGLTMPVFATQSQTITVDPINVMVGGKVFLPTDVNGKDVPVFVYSGTTYAPLRALAEAYGLAVGYNAEKKLATVDGTPSADFVGSKGTKQALSKRTSLMVSAINIEVNGTLFKPKDANGNSVSVFNYNGTTYAPLRALAEAYGLTVGYDQQKKLATVDFVAVEGIDFGEILKEVAAERAAAIQNPNLFPGFRDYLINDPATENLLTQAEIDALRNTEDKTVHTVTAEQAISDIDLLFRALRVCYGSYYYFGEEAWKQAEAEVMAWLDGQATVSVAKLTEVLRTSLLFMVDRHSYVGSPIVRVEGIQYEYHYCTEQRYDRDSDTWFKVVNGKRLELVGFSDDRVTLEPTLLADGKMVYSPVLHCVPAQAVAVTVTLKAEDGTICTETIRWTQAKENPGSGRDPNYQFVMENGLAYINIDCFEHEQYDLYAELPGTGSKVRNCKAVIFDLRGNAGGPGDPTEEWIRNFAGRVPEAREAVADRINPLYNPGEKRSIYEVRDFSAGKRVPNNTPVIVLVDDECGSNGEVALMRLEGMDNVLVVGTNTAGCQLGGNYATINLPHTNIDARIGTMLHFFDEIKNIDCIGYLPDVWCEAYMALDAALNLLVNEGIVDAETAAAFGEKVHTLNPEENTRDEIMLKFEKISPKKGQGFGIGGGTHVATVHLNGTPTSDYTATVADPFLCTARKTADGGLALTAVKPGETTLTVQCGDVVQKFPLEVK